MARSFDSFTILIAAYSRCFIANTGRPISFISMAHSSTPFLVLAIAPSLMVSPYEQLPPLFLLSVLFC
jgi:hypothetical protein